MVLKFNPLSTLTNDLALHTSRDYSGDQKNKIT